jgi:hypothetical protein
MKRVLKFPGTLENPPSSPFFKGGDFVSSLWKREVGRDFWERFSNTQIDTKLEIQKCHE